MNWRAAGFVAALAFAAAAPAAQAPVSEWAESALTRLAIETAPDGPIAPAEMVVEGRPLIGVYDRVKIPIKLIGTGEKVGDLKDFKAADFAESLFD